jgi:hypothetical protein
MLKGMTALLAFALVSACASHSKAIPAKPVVRRIAIIPASDPVWYTLENAAPPIGYPMQFWVNKLDSKHKAKVFNDRLHSPPITLGSDFTEQMASALRGYEFTVEILQGVVRPAGDPDNVDEDRVSSDADALLHLRITEVGMYSSHMSTDYLPRVNASGKLTNFPTPPLTT